MKIDKIGFIGLGLIGGSIALKIKELYPNAIIIANSHTHKTIQEAHDMGIIANDTLLSPEDFKDCDLIFLCAPVEVNIDALSQLKNVIKEDCLITDVGSTKSMIHKAAEEAGLKDRFIGGHPMTGSEKTGLSYANPLFLENAYYVITPYETTDSVKLESYVELIRSFGCIPLVLDYQKHDHATAAISHLPHMIAFALTHLIEEIDDENETMKTIAAGSFRDLTRVAASSPAMWESIAHTNRAQILTLMDEFEDTFHKLRNTIDTEKQDELYHYFANAKNYRDSLNLPAKNSKSLLHEIYLDLEDEAGGIATIATILAQEMISIKNIGIIHNREFEEGILRIEFYDEYAKENAINTLTNKHYTIHIR